jgi:hypothetical protein
MIDTTFQHTGVPPDLRGTALLDTDAGQLLFRADDTVMRPLIAESGVWAPELGRIVR